MFCYLACEILQPFEIANSDFIHFLLRHELGGQLKCALKSFKDIFGRGQECFVQQASSYHIRDSGPVQLSLVS